MVLVGAQRVNLSSVGHGGLDREFQRENHELEAPYRELDDHGAWWRSIYIYIICI